MPLFRDHGQLPSLCILLEDEPPSSMGREHENASQSAPCISEPLCCPPAPVSPPSFQGRSRSSSIALPFEGGYGTMRIVRLDAYDDQSDAGIQPTVANSGAPSGSPGDSPDDPLPTMKILACARPCGKSADPPSRCRYQRHRHHTHQNTHRPRVQPLSARG